MGTLNVSKKNPAIYQIVVDQCGETTGWHSNFYSKIPMTAEGHQIQ